MTTDRWRDSWAGRTSRRLGRMTAAWVAGGCGLVVPALYIAFADRIQGDRLAESCLGGLLVASLVFLGLDKLGVVPDDSDPPTPLDIRNQ